MHTCRKCFENNRCVLLFTLRAERRRAQDKMVFKMIRELMPEDNMTIPAADIVRECSELLKSRDSESAEKVCAALRRRGSAYLQLINKGDAAKDDFDALCKLRPNDPEARSLLALALADLEQFPASLVEIREAIRLNPRLPDQYAQLAGILWMRGNWHEAQVSASVALKIDGNFAMAHYITGLISFKQGNYPECVASLNKYLEIRPFGGLRVPGQPYSTRGLALLYLNRPRDALSNFLMAKKLDPSSSVAAWGVCMAYCDLRRYHMAARASDDLAKLMPPNHADIFLHAVHQAKIGKIKVAEESIRRALAIAPPKDADAAAYASVAYFAIGDYAKVSKYVEAALELDPKCQTALEQKAILQSTCPDAKYRNGANALAILKKIYQEERLSKRGEQLGTLCFLADAHAECGDFDNAVALAKKALELAGPDRELAEYQERVKMFENKKPYRHSVGDGSGTK